MTSSSPNGLYVAFKPTNQRLERGAKVGVCARCPAIIAHFPRDSQGHEVICLKCANDIPQIARHLDRLAKARGD